MDKSKSEEKERRLKDKRQKKWNETHRIIDNVDYKSCSTCNEYKPSTIEYFYSNKSNNIDGLHPNCKVCTITKTKQWRVENPEKARSLSKEERERKPEYFKIHRKRHYINNKDKEKQRLKEWYQHNKDRLKYYRDNHRNHDITEQELLECKEYFKWSCAYCGLHEAEHLILFNEQLHKEHVIHNGSNGIENCIPACKACNSSKSDSEFNDWYNESNPNYSKRRLNKIIKWMTDDCFKI